MVSQLVAKDKTIAKQSVLIDKYCQTTEDNELDYICVIESHNTEISTLNGTIEAQQAEHTRMIEEQGRTIENQQDAMAGYEDQINDHVLTIEEQRRTIETERNEIVTQRHTIRERDNAINAHTRINQE